MRAHNKFLLFLVTGHLSLATLLTGCESVQKKFTRKSKTEIRPSPIVNFQDYTQAMTPLDRYRKHYVLFDYWNDQLLDTIQDRQMNLKRAQHASSEALGELRTMQGLLQEESAARITPLVEERVQIDRQLQGGSSQPSQLSFLRHTLETQTRQIHRELFWRDMQDQLKDQDKEQTAGDAGRH